MPLDYKVIGNRIKSIRKSKDITQEEFAYRLDVSPTYLGNVERGTSQINLKRLTQISELLDIPIQYLIEGSVEKSKDYLIKEFADVLKTCTPEKQKMILEIARLVAKSK